MMHKLTIDPSTSPGWCLFLDDSDKPEEEQRSAGERLSYGTWDLGRKKRRGQYYLNLWEQFNDLRRKHGIEDDDIEIIIEAEAYGARRTEASAQLAAGWLATLEIICERRGLTYPRTVTTTSWRKAFIGRAFAPKEIVGTDARRKWLKEAVLAECRRRGLRPEDDNSADAIGLMFFVVRGGLLHQEHSRAEKKAKTAAKRAQKKLDLQVAA